MPCAARRPRLPGLSALAGVLLAGCTLSPPGPPLQPPPAGLPPPSPAPPPPADTAHPPLPGWLHDLDDPRLPGLVHEALEHNRDLQAAAARLQAADQLARAEAAALRPQLGARVEANRLRTRLELPTGTVPAYRTTAGAGLDISWEPDLWGRLRHTASAARADAQAARDDAEAARHAIAARTASAWLDLLTQHLLLQLARDTAASDRDQAQAIEDRFQRGLAEALDLRLARSAEATSRATVAIDTRAREEAVRQLEILLGRYPGADLEPVSRLPALIRPVPAHLPDALLERRPDLRAAERRLAAAGARTTAAERQRLPGIVLTASGGVSSEALDQLTDDDARIGSIGAVLRLPLYTGNRIDATTRQADARQRAAAADYAAAALTAYLEVESALHAEQTLHDQLRALADAADHAEAARQLAWDRYQRGLADILTVLDSRRRATLTQRQLLQARKLRLQNRILLHLALGGGPGQTVAPAQESRP